MSKYFTLSEAQGLLGALESLLRDAIEARREAVSMDQALQALGARVAMMGGSEIDPVAAAEKKLRKQAAMDRASKAVEAIQGHGCLVKDLDIGLIDFPTMLDDRPALFCWRMGEPKIEFWHGIDEGFAGRKPITDLGKGSTGETRKPH